MLQWCRRRTTEAVLRDEGTRWCEELNAMIARVGTGNLTARVDCHIPRVLEVAWCGSFGAEFEFKSKGIVFEVIELNTLGPLDHTSNDKPEFGGCPCQQLLTLVPVSARKRCQQAG